MGLTESLGFRLGIGALGRGARRVAAAAAAMVAKAAVTMPKLSKSKDRFDHSSQE